MQLNPKNTSVKNDIPAEMLKGSKDVSGYLTNVNNNPKTNELSQNSLKNGKSNTN